MLYNYQYVGDKEPTVIESHLNVEYVSQYISTEKPLFDTHIAAYIGGRDTPAFTRSSKRNVNIFKLFLQFIRDYV